MDAAKSKSESNRAPSFQERTELQFFYGVEGCFGVFVFVFFHLALELCEQYDHCCSACVTVHAV